MKASIEPLEGNKVKLSVEVEEAEFDKAIEAAFRRIAREVRLPGFRPGKAPRRLLEARLGKDVGREEALREALPEYYSQAVRENDVDVIAAPDIEITSGKEEGAVAFDAVVEVRPRIIVPGYGGLRVAVPRPEATDEEIDGHVERLREQFGELAEVDRPAIDSDHVTMSITGSRAGEVLAGLQADDYLYEVGSGSIATELDDNLRGAKVGDVLTFDAQPADPDEAPVQFRVLVKDVKQKVLPEVSDEWANDVSEFDTVDELRADIADRITKVRTVQAAVAVRQRTIAAVIGLVEDEPPDAMVNAEIRNQLQNLALRLSAQGVTAEQYLEATGKTQDDLLAELGPSAIESVKADLALRSVADAEGIEATDDDVEEELAALATRVGEKLDKVRREFERNDQVPAVRSDIRKRKALDWLVEHAEIVDADGQPIDRASLELRDHDDDPATTADSTTTDSATDEVTIDDTTTDETTADGEQDE